MKHIATIIIERPTSDTEVTEHSGLIVQHLHPCEMMECDGVARHVADDGTRMCDICWEIECDVL